MNEENRATWDETPSGDAVRVCLPKVYAEYLDLRDELKAIAQKQNWSRNEVARLSGIPIGTLSQWFSGKYSGRYDRINERVRKYLAALGEMSEIARTLPAGPGYIETRTAREIVETFTYAQMMPGMAIVTIAAGNGKTTAAKHYIETRPHAYLATMSPATRKVHGMLTEIADCLGISTLSASRLHRAIGKRLGQHPRSLLILDEAQNLSDEAVDQARAFLDQFSCGVVLMGNEEIYTRFDAKTDGPSYAQIRRRIGKKMWRRTPYAEDIKALIDGWGVDDAAARKFLVGIGQKHGALGSINETMKLASILAAGAGEKDVTERFIRAAWENRGLEDS